MSQSIDAEELASQVGALTPHDAQPESPAATSRRLQHRHTVLLFLGVVAGRCAFSANRTVFNLFPDGPAMLGMARWLSGQAAWDMANARTWRPGFPTLLAPIFWFTDDQQTIVRAGLVIAAVLAGVSAVVMAHLALRITQLSPRGSRILVAGAVALTPASMSASAYLWAEPLVTLIFLSTVMALLRFFDRPRLGAGALAIVLSVAGYTSHGRLLPLVITAIVATAGAFARLRRWRDSSLLLVLAIALIGASEWYASWFYDALWNDPSEVNTVGAVVDRLTDPIGVAVAGVGQLWYLLASTVGLFGVGMAVLTRHATRRSEGQPYRTDARVLLACTLPLIALSVVFMTNRERVDQQIYGRYNDAVVWPVLVIALAWFAAHTGTHWRELDRKTRLAIAGIAAAFVESGMVVEITLRTLREQQLSLFQMIPGIAPALDMSRGVRVILITVVSLTVFTLLITLTSLSRVRQRLFVVVAICALALAVVRTHELLSVDLNAGEESSSVRDLSGHELPIGSTVVYGFVPIELDPGVDGYLQGYYAQLYQWYLPDHRFRIIFTGDYPIDGYVFAPVKDRILQGRAACIVWRDPAVALALWDTGTSCPDPDS